MRKENLFCYKKKKLSKGEFNSIINNNMILNLFIMI